jgi:hypothetical protein
MSSRPLKQEWEKVDWTEPNTVIAVRMGVTDIAVSYQRKMRAKGVEAQGDPRAQPDIRNLYRSKEDSRWYLTMGAAGEFDAVWSMGKHLVRAECGVCGTKEQWNGEGWACPHGHVKVEASEFDQHADAMLEVIKAKAGKEKRPEFLRALNETGSQVDLARRMFHHYSRIGEVKPS